jgi:hypothetical protein
VLAFMHDVAGQSSQPKWQLSPEIEKSAGENQKPSEQQKDAPEFAEGIHD